MKDLLPPLTLVATGLAACLVCPPAEADEARPTIRLGQVGLSVSAVTGAVVPELLERDGHEVELTVGSHAGIFPRLGAGEVDILAATWRPGGHAALFAPVEDVTFRITARDDDARFHRAVPHDVAEDAVASIADLAKPEVQARMPARIVSRPEATGLTTGGRRVMEASALGGRATTGPRRRRRHGPARSARPGRPASGWCFRSGGTRPSRSVRSRNREEPMVRGTRPIFSAGRACAESSRRRPSSGFRRSRSRSGR